MSYSRYSESPFYIYPSGYGVMFTGSGEISDDEIDLFLFRLASRRPEELESRIAHGKQVIKEYLEFLKEDDIEAYNFALKCNPETDQ